MIDLTAEERALVLRMAADKQAYTERCAERCLREKTPANIKANGAQWMHEAELWKSIYGKVERA